MLLRRFLLFLLLTALLCGCKESHHEGLCGEETPVTTAQITILVYHPYVSDMTAVLASDYADVLESVKNHDGLPTLQLLHFSAPVTDKAYLIESKYNSLTQTFVNDTLQSYSFVTTDYTQPEGLAKVIADVKAVQKAEKLGMIIGSHANGWIPVAKAKGERAFGSGGDNRYKTNFTTLAEAITNNGITLDFLVIDDCNSQNIENAYDLRNAAKYILASATEIMMEGIPYKESFHLLVNEEYEAFCDAFIGFYKEYTSPYATLSIVDCSQFDGMVNVMREINSRFELEEADREGIQPLGGTSSSDPFFYDFEDYVKRLCKDETLLEEFDRCLAELVPLYYYTDEFFWTYYSDAGRVKTEIYPINTFCGITCSDPCQSLQSKLKETAWYKATHEE